MKRILVLMALATFAAAPAFAQSRSVDVTGWVTWADPSGDTFENVDDIEDVEVEFDSEQGYGLGINFFLSDRISAEIAAHVLEPDLNLRFSDPTIPFTTFGSLEMIPITATLQFHFAPEGRFDPYIGAGAAWVLFDEVSGAALDDIDVDSIDFDDDFGFVVNAGVSIGLTELIAINLDAKYVPVSSAARAVIAGVPGEAIDIDVNPTILSAGISLQF